MPTNQSSQLLGVLHLKDSYGNLSVLSVSVHRDPSLWYDLRLDTNLHDACEHIGNVGGDVKLPNFATSDVDTMLGIISDFLRNGFLEITEFVKPVAKGLREDDYSQFARLLEETDGCVDISKGDLYSLAVTACNRKKEDYCSCGNPLNLDGWDGKCGECADHENNALG